MNKLIVITGASSGIGEATAKLFSAKGHPLLLLSRRLERMEALQLPNCMCRKVDVTDAEALQQAVAEAEAKFGDVDCIINNAGMMLLGDVGTQNAEEWQKMLNVNMMGVLNGIQAVLPKMRRQQTGTIINVSSVAGRKNYDNHAAYCGTKFGVHAITEGVRIENALNNVRMVTISPGAVETELLSHTSSEAIRNNYESWKKEIGGVLKSEDIANAIWYAYSQPQGVNVREIVIAATKQQP